MDRMTCLKVFFLAAILVTFISLLITIYGIDVHPTKRIFSLERIAEYRKKSLIQANRKYSNDSVQITAISHWPSTFGEYIDLILVIYLTSLLQSAGSNEADIACWFMMATVGKTFAYKTCRIKKLLQHILVI